MNSHASQSLVDISRNWGFLPNTLCNQRRYDNRIIDQDGILCDGFKDLTQLSRLKLNLEFHIEMHDASITLQK